jgi:NAD+ kinase
MTILIVTRDENQKMPTILEKIKDKKIVWKDKLNKSHLKEVKLVLTLGGDGTFLSTAHFIDNQLILGINDNPKRSEGYLTTATLKTLDKKLQQISKNKIKIKEYTREKVNIIKKDCCIITEHALNETYFGNINPHHPSNYKMIYKNKKESQRSSGVLITTGTGSTAWYKAMGGRKYSKVKNQLRFKTRELFSGRLYKSKTKKGKISSKEKLTLISKMNHGILAIDSIRTYEIHEQDKIEISIGKPLRVIQ